jgi:4-amino-4-deoxy-L-arabinose transferase-like glycosyltransferase
MALSLRIFFIIYNYLGSYIPYGGEHEDIAWNILAGLGFSFKPYWMPSGGPTAAVSPVYPYFLALIFSLFPIDKFLVIQYIQAVVSSLTCISGYFIAKRIFGRRIAVLSTLLIALSIFMIRTSLMIRRTSFIVLFLSLVVLYSLKMTEAKRFRDWAIYGLLQGVTILISPEVSVFAPLALAWIFYHNPMKRKAKIYRLVLMLAMLVLIISPWTIRNYMVFKRLVPIASSFGANFWEGNNPNASGSDYLYPYGYTRLTEKLKKKMSPDMNEIERIDILQKEALEYIRWNPRRFLELRVKSFFYFWFSHYNWEKLNSYPFNIVTFAPTLLMNILAIIGIIFCCRKWGTFLLIMLLASFSLIYTVTHASVMYRYRLPLDPYLLMFAATVLARIIPQHYFNLPQTDT